MQIWVFKILEKGGSMFWKFNQIVAWSTGIIYAFLKLCSCKIAEEQLHMTTLIFIQVNTWRPLEMVPQGPALGKCNVGGFALHESDLSKENYLCRLHYYSKNTNIPNTILPHAHHSAYNPDQETHGYSFLLSEKKGEKKRKNNVRRYLWRHFLAFRKKKKEEK